MKIGDTVRFLNAVGGGRVVRIDGRMAYVEEADGFETPVLVSECVVVADVHTPPAQKTAATSPSKAAEKYDAPVPAPRPAALPVVETPDGDTLNAVLYFEPQNIKTLSTSSFDAYFVNDSNYWLYVTIASRGRSDRQWSLRYDGLIEPNMQEFVWELTQTDLAATDRLLVQMCAFKRSKTFEAKSPVNLDFKFDATKFARLHCFRPHRYFDAPVIAYDIVKADHTAEVFQPDAEDIRRGIAARKTVPAAESRPVSRSSKPAKEPIVVDLHASELLDTTAGLSPADILNLQVDTFRATMDAHLRNAGCKIVFIHGKGEGVLRQAIMKELAHRYKGHDVHDASFAEYGFGATQVTIRPEAAQNAAATSTRKRR